MPDGQGSSHPISVQAVSCPLSQRQVLQRTARAARAQAMLRFAAQERAEFAILTDMSAACGSQVVTMGTRGCSSIPWSSSAR